MTRADLHFLNSTANESNLCKRQVIIGLVFTNLDQTDRAVGGTLTEATDV